MEHFYQNIFGWSRPEDQGVLLEYILKTLDSNEKIRIAEIGVYLGRATAMWNVELINKNLDYEYYAIDHFLGSSEHEKGVDYYGSCIKNLEPIKDRIKILRNNSVDESKNYDDGFFDIVYIDASHEYEFVLEDIKSWFPKVRNGGFVCGDDYCDSWPGVEKAVNEFFGKEVQKIGNTQWLIKKL